MEKIKILLFCSLPGDLNNIKGGVESVCVNLLEGFRDYANAEVHAVSFSKEINERKDVIIAQQQTITYLPYHYGSELADYFLNRRGLHTVINEFKPDIIHIQGAAPFLLRFAGYPKSNIVVTQHGIMAQELKLVKGIKRKLKFFVKLLIEKYYFPRFINYVFISKYNQKLFAPKPHQFTEVIDNPVNSLFFKSSTVEPEPGSIIYLGWISELKNLVMLLEALYILKSEGILFKLTVIGSFKEEWYKQKVLNFIFEKGLKHIVFEGKLPPQLVREKLEASTFFVLPSLQENLPVSIAEAMAIGKIVISTNVGAVSEMFIHGQSGYLLKNNTATELAALLRDFHTKTPNLVGISENARAAALKRFHPAEVAGRTIQFYNKALSR